MQNIVMQVVLSVYLLRNVCGMIKLVRVKAVDVVNLIRSSLSVNVVYDHFMLQ